MGREWRVFWLCAMCWPSVSRPGGDGTHIALKAKILEHLRKLKLACGNLFWVYKHHAAAKHLARQLELHGLLIALFTQERRHKLLKKYVQGRKKGQSWERGLMEEVTLQHLHDLKSQWWHSSLHDLMEPKPWVAAGLNTDFPEARDKVVSSAVTLSSGASAHVGDVVALRVGDDILVGELHDAQ